MTLEDRIRGAVYGALVGDALGVPVEFTDRQQRSNDPVNEMRSGGTWGQRAGTWSDDGALLLCTVEGLADHAAPQQIGRLFVDWMQHGRWAARGSVFDIGRTTENALSRIADGFPPDTCGESENGNGSLMRILPVGLRFGTDDEAALFRHAMEISALTHGHPRSQLACTFYCLAISLVLSGASLKEAYTDAIRRAAAVFVTHPPEQSHFARILSGRLGELPDEQIQSSGYVVHTLEASLWCVLQKTDFRSAVLAAVNLGGDTDTTGCVTGGLAGAFYGIDAIPAEWLAALPRRAEVDVLLNRFNHVCQSRSPQ